jgi:excisionase family DNA binding protein
MSLFDERALREIVAEELRRVLREEQGRGSGPANDGEYLPVAEAAARAAVAPGTIRAWMAQGRLRRYHAGRELRVLASELTALMRRPAVRASTGGDARPAPEEEAARYLERRRRRAT